MPFFKLFRPLLVVVAILGHAAETHAADEIFWYRDLKQASTVAQEAGRPIFIDFWADWCTPCKAMDSQVYSNPKVIEAFKRKLVGVRLNFDLQRETARKFNVWGLPHLVFTNSYGTPLISHRGFMAAQDLANVVDAIPPLEEINSLDRRLQQNKDDLATVLAMGRALGAAGFFESSKLYYDRAARHSGARTDPTVRESILYEQALNLLELRDSKQAAGILEICLKEFSTSVRKPEFLLALARSYVMSGLTGKARVSLNSILSDYPESTAANQARVVLKSL
jgi:thiol-disulfide isomerase/thioredoxin